MKALINKQLITKLQPKDKQYEIWDTRLTGFVLRINPSGKMNYICQYKKHRRVTIGAVNILNPMQARSQAKEILGNATKGIYPEKYSNHPSDKKHLTIKKFIEEKYAPWKKQDVKSGKEMIRSIRSHFFKEFGDLQLDKIEGVTIEDWRTRKKASGLKPASINRPIAYLKSAFSKAVAWKLLPTNPLREIKALKENNDRVRYLSEAETNILREALANREASLKQARESANTWRKERNYKLFAQFDTDDFADYLRPMVLLALNTGLRRGELFSLTWDRIDFLVKNLTVTASNAKSNKTRHVPLNSEAFDVLEQWHKQSLKSGLVFPNKDGKRFDNINKSWGNLLDTTVIKNFHFHDLRHDFASKLVMAGVDLNTVRELLGHSDIKMTLRYAHLAPAHKANAVAKLVTTRKKL